ncbi:MAG TPA: carboxypeptidase regulatory-like domain-containing protein [Thermoanaerobaculia bacterium]|nr:carboxypeptidase regulatory-like domain-containing protein [Thermoanaerobaculia bacterium]
MLALAPGALQAQGSCVRLNGGCTPPEQPGQCFPDALGPITWTDPGGARTTQVRFLANSPNSTCHPPVGIGAPPHCCTSFHPPASPGPSVKLRIVGRRVWVDYDAPNYYCQNTGDWPPFFTCTNDPLASADNLFLFRNGDLLQTAFIYYENGSWDTGIDVACGGTQTFTARIGYVVEPVQLTEAFDTKTLKAVCPDRRDCPYGVGKPVNPGSGDVAATVPLFTLAQAPLSLSFSLSYHSGTPLYPGLVAAPAGLGWTHLFAQTLRPTDATNRVLYHLTPEGFESEYTQSGVNTWIASSPGELRGTVTLASGQFALTDLDGRVTRFDAATGKWLSTTDRWGNTLSGIYDASGNLATVADAEGRQVTLAYVGGFLSSITLPDGPVWRLIYDGPNLAAIFDPLHPGATPWRSFTYAADSQGVIRLLTEVRDEAGALLEGHSYDAADRGTTSISAGGKDSVTIEYDTPSPGQSRTTHEIDGTTSQLSIFSLTYGKGRFLPDRIQGNCATCGVATSDDQSFTYGPDNHVLSKTDGNGHLTRYTYNADGNVTSMTEAAGTAIERTTTYRYGYAPWPNFRTEVDEPSAAKPGAQKVTTMTWNTTGTPETTLTAVESGFLSPSDAAPTPYTSTATFDARHRHVSANGPRTDVADVVTTAYYDDADPVADRRGRVARRTDATGLVTTFDGYDVFGTARTVTDPNGVVTTRETDGRGRLIRSTAKAVPGDASESADYVSTYTYDGRDRLLRTLLPRGNGMSYGYEDGTNHLIDTIRLDAAGNQVERRHLTLNTIGGKVQEEDQSCDTPAPVCASWTTKRSESFTYDLHNRLASVAHPVPAGSKVTYAYDPDGLLSAVQDEVHASPNTRNGYDALHRLTQVQQTLAGAPGGIAGTSYSYDVMDDLAAVTDPNGNVTRYQYDDFRRLARQDSPVTGATTYQYDPAGNLTSTTDARGAVTTRTYDASNRLLASTTQLAGSAAETVTYSYDAAAAGNYGKGRLAQMTDPSGSTTYTYERRGLLKGEVQTILGTPYTMDFRYDQNGNRSLFTYPSGRQVTYTFDFADRPLSATSGTTSYVSSAGYLPFGPETRTAYGNGTTRTFSYDLRYRPTENRLDGAALPIADYLYQEDPVGNITSLHDALDPSFNRDFAYDDLYRLTGATTGESLWGNGSYRYDPMGNMTSLALGSARSLSFSYQGTLPQLATVAVPGGGSRAVTYDPAGNEITVGGATSTYSARNLLAAADGLTYTYDGRGVRTALSVAAALGAITGTVLDAGTGAPIAGATVRLTGTGNTAVTDAAGHYVLTAAAGIYTLTAAQVGYLPTTGLPLNLPAGADVTADPLRLSPAPGKITGTVLSSLDGNPLAGVAVTVPETGLAAFTDAAGSFTLEEPAGTYSLALALPGYLTQTLPAFALAAGRTHAVGTVTLVALPATVTGRVLNSVSGAGLAGATVTATPRTTGLAAATPVFATTDAAGNFTLSLASGTYSLTITATGFASRTTASIGLGPGASYAFGNLTLDPLGTITGTVVKSTDGMPIGGATVTITGTLNQATTDASGAFTLTQPPGTYTLSVQAGGFADLVTPPFTLAPGGTHNAGTLPLLPVALSVFVGYADNLRASSAFPVPWQGSPNVVFLGNGPVFDAGAVRLDNATDEPIAVDGVQVDLGRPGPVYNLWGSFTIPSHGSVILTQTTPFNFDTSDFAIVGCGQTLAPGEPRVPRVQVTVGGVGTTYFDTGHILDTGGYDLACRANESLQWRLIGTTGINSNGDFLLAPVTGTSPLGSSYTLTATLTDANNQPLPNVTVTFKATSGPNTGRTGQAVTDATGKASFSYGSTFAGTDTWQGTVVNASGGSLLSNPATVVWPSLAGIEVFVGYADNLRANSSFPTPWQGSPNVVFLGGGPSFDAGAVRLDNTGDSPLLVDKVVVDLQRPGPVFDLWGSFTIPAHGSAILTQNFSYNFDTSDFDLVGCGGTLSPNEKRIPKITVTIGGFSGSYLDTAHIIDTFGYDLACRDNESLQWRPVGAGGTTASGQLALRPDVATHPVGALHTVTAAATDAVGEPLANVTVQFNVLSGPNAGKTGQSVTNAAGIATFTYTSAATGTDTLKATITNPSGGVIASNQVTSSWIPTVSLSLTPAIATQAVGTPYNATLLATDGAGHPVANLTVTFQIGSGPNTGRTAQGTTNAAGQSVFTYTSTLPGSDLLAASITLQGGAALTSNQVTANWTSPLTLTLAPLSATAPLGSSLTFTSTLADASHRGAPGVPVTFQVLNGPNAGATGQATTDASGQAAFTYTSSALGTDTLVATAAQGSGAITSNLATATWIAIPTTLVYLGPAGGETLDPLTLQARLTESATGRPLAGQSVAFNFGGQLLTATTDGSGVASVTLTPTAAPGTIPLTLTFTGTGPYTGSGASLLFGLRRDETAIVYTGKPVAANGIAQPVSARLTDGEDGAPLAGKTVTFTLGPVSVSAVTDANGVANATLTLPATLATGLAVIQVAFAGDTYEQPAQTTAPIVVYQPSSFVVWGGNTSGLDIGQRVNFWGSQWEQQVLGGDYNARSAFKGYGTMPSSSIGICEPTATTTGTPRLDQGCWTSKPGNSSPPATLADFIQVIVATSANKSGSTVYGNIAATVVVEVDRTVPYSPNPGHPGFGTIVAVIDDGAGLFPATRAAAAIPKSAVPAAGLAVTAPVAKTAAATTVQSTSLPAVSAGTHQFYFYTPELNLLAETELSTNAHPQINNEYIWWNGHPVAQVDSTGTTSWTFTDHLGTPILQTSAQQGVVWRAEYEPFGTVYALRSYDRHQPLRLPGQEAEQLGLGANGVTERSYNIHRWYDAGKARYREADPLSLLQQVVILYQYAGDNPVSLSDPLGLRRTIIIPDPTNPFGPPIVKELYGTLVNNSDCCVLVSGNDDLGKLPGQQQHWIKPHSNSGTYDVDAIYFRDGGAIKIRDGITHTISNCSELNKTPTSSWYSSYKSLPNRKAIEDEFGTPIRPPQPLPCCCNGTSYDTLGPQP